MIRSVAGRVLRILAGAVAGYLVFIGLVLAKVAWRAIRIHYFDREQLLDEAYVVPIGGLAAYATGQWRGYPAWLYLHELCAYALMTGGAVLALRLGRGASK